MILSIDFSDKNYELGLKVGFNYSRPTGIVESRIINLNNKSYYGEMSDTEVTVRELEGSTILTVDLTTIKENTSEELLSSVMTGLVRLADTTI